MDCQEEGADCNPAVASTEQEADDHGLSPTMCIVNIEMNFSENSIPPVVIGSALAKPTDFYSVCVCVCAC